MIRKTGNKKKAYLRTLETGAPGMSLALEPGVNPVGLLWDRIRSTAEAPATIDYPLGYLKVKRKLIVLLNA
jgi:hypothetical protein